jgi:hypothetical protein
MSQTSYGYIGATNTFDNGIHKKKFESVVDDVNAKPTDAPETDPNNDSDNETSQTNDATESDNEQGGE